MFIIMPLRVYGSYRKHLRGSTVAKSDVRIWRPAAKPANFGFRGPQNGRSGNLTTRHSAVPGKTKNR
jgi:hypothetical protein